MGNGACSENGVCDSVKLTCNCNTGFGGFACEKASCPTGASWYDIPVDGIAHVAVSECSRGGICYEGECFCQNGIFTGDDCSLMECVNDCEGHGECKTISELAAVSNDSLGIPVAYSYTAWDADKVRTCSCNKTRAHDNYFSGSSDTYRGPQAYVDTDWTGYDCTHAKCVRVSGLCDNDILPIYISLLTTRFSK